MTSCSETCASWDQTLIVPTSLPLCFSEAPGYVYDGKVLKSVVIESVLARVLQLSIDGSFDGNAMDE